MLKDILIEPEERHSQKKKIYTPYDLKSWESLPEIKCQVCGYIYRERLYDGVDTIVEFGGCPKCSLKERAGENY